MLVGVSVVREYLQAVNNNPRKEQLIKQSSSISPTSESHLSLE